MEAFAAKLVGSVVGELRSLTTALSSVGTEKTTVTREDFELRAPRASYAMNQYAITLSDRVPLIQRDSARVEQQRGEDVATLIHEYIHYLHNFSTLAGITKLVQHHTSRRRASAAAGSEQTDVALKPRARRATIERVLLASPPPRNTATPHDPGRSRCCGLLDLRGYRGTRATR